MIGLTSSVPVPQNFFLANPDLQGGADLTTNNGRTNYHSLQLELRRRLSRGLEFGSSYVFGEAVESVWETWRRPNFMVRNTGAEGDLTHAFKAYATYELPFGQGRRFGGNSGGIVDRIIGGWSINVASRVQSGRLVDVGNVRLVGMSVKDVQNGDCALRSLVVTGPMYQQHDITLAKRVRLIGRSNFEFRFEMLNAFNHHNFAPVAGISNDPADYEVTGLTGTNTARVIQLVTRINW